MYPTQVKGTNLVSYSDLCIILECDTHFTTAMCILLINLPPSIILNAALSL